MRTIPHKKYAKKSIDNLFKSNHLSKNHRKSLLYVYKSINKHIKNNYDKEKFSKEFEIFVNEIQHVNSKYHNYLNAVKMQIDKLYKRITYKNFNTFYKVLNWLGKN
ncbi:hypothetical protein N8129_03805 [Pelagibacteraceae bacterium]|nr:hypothetical protein [Pelagibacteraceae bacterium]